MNTENKTNMEENAKVAVGVTVLGKSDSYSLLGPYAGQNLRYKLERGVKIFASGYAGNMQYFVITGKNDCGENIYDAVELYEEIKPSDLDKFYLGGYFSHRTRVDGNTVRPYSQMYGIGLYFDDTQEAKLISEEIIENSIACADRLDEIKREEEERIKREEEETRERLLKDYAYLKRVEKPYDHKTCGENIRTELKHEFPGHKFSVRYKSFTGGDEYVISWKDGPTREKVDAIVNKYADMHPDAYSQGDYWDSVPSIFNNLYGSVGYISTSQYISDEAIESVKQKLVEDYPGIDAEPFDADRLPQWSFYGKPSSLDDYARWKAGRTDFYVKPEKQISVSCEGLSIEDYSEKAFVVLGDTRSIKDKLKQLGGKFNPRLKCGAGWIFSKKKESEVREALSL